MGLHPPHTNLAINLDETRKTTRVYHDTIREIIQDLEEGEAFEELNYQKVERYETDEAFEDVIYVRGKTHPVFTPKKEREGARQAFWSMLRPVQEVAEQVERGQNQEKVIFGQEDGAKHTTMSAFTRPVTPVQQHGDWHADRMKDGLPEAVRSWGGEQLGHRSRWEKGEEEKAEAMTA